MQRYLVTIHCMAALYAFVAIHRNRSLGFFLRRQFLYVSDISSHNIA